MFLIRFQVRILSRCSGLKIWIDPLLCPDPGLVFIDRVRICIRIYQFESGSGFYQASSDQSPCTDFTNTRLQGPCKGIPYMS